MTRIEREDSRAITDIKFDIHFKDTFEEDIAVIRNVICDLGRYSLDSNIEYVDGSRNIIGGRINITMKYSGLVNQQLEQLRKYPYDIKYEANITSIVFDDGSVLND